MRRKESTESILVRNHDGEITLNENVSRDLFVIEQELNTLKERREEILKQAVKEMEDAGVKLAEDDNIKLIYIAGTQRFTLDSGRMKKEAPALYDKFKKLSEVSSSVRVTCK